MIPRARIVFILMVAASTRAFTSRPMRSLHMKLRAESLSPTGDAETPLAADQVDPKKTSVLMLGSTTSLARRTAVEALSNALLRSLDRTSEATAMIGEELVSVGEILDTEIQGEEERLAGVEKLVGMLKGVVKGKAEVVQRETELLNKMQGLKQKVIEHVITERLDEAANAKAELISIEMVLSETMVACKIQLEVTFSSFILALEHNPPCQLQM